MRTNWGSILVDQDFGEKIKRYLRISNWFLASWWVEENTHATVDWKGEGGEGEDGMRGEWSLGREDYRISVGKLTFFESLDLSGDPGE